MAKFESIRELFDWSENYTSGRNPYVIFLDLIGYSFERYGVNCYVGEDYHSVLGYKELCMLSEALHVFKDTGYDEVYSFCDYLEPDNIPTDEQYEEWERLGFNPPTTMTEKRYANA